MQSLTTSYQSVSENTGTLAGEQSWQEFFLCCDVSEKAGRSSFYAAMYLKKLAVTGFSVKSTIFIFLFVQVCSKI